MSVKGFNINGGLQKYDYNYLENIPSFSLKIDDDDGMLYITVNGQKQGEGVDVSGGGPPATKYNITSTLQNATLSNTASKIAEGNTYTSQVNANAGYRTSTVTVTMGGATQSGAYNAVTGTITVANVSGDIAITVYTELLPIDLLNVTWADHAISCGQSTNSYNAWSPHDLQYDSMNDCYVFLQCHANKHLNQTYTTWTLSLINPYDATDVTAITIPSYDGMGSLWVENGTWWIFPKYLGVAYRSSDMGANWETVNITKPSGMRMFGIYKCGGTYFSGNDSNSEITYYKSDDLLTWEVESFDSSLGYSILCETTFCEFDGKYWAFNRTNDAELGHPVILQSTDEGETWTLFSDQDLHGYRSTVSCYPFQNYIVVADIDRDGHMLYYSKFDGEAFTQLNSWSVPSAGDDFHNVNITSNYKDTVIIEFMHNVPYYDNTAGIYYTDRACDNVMLVGSTKPLASVTKTQITTSTDLLDWLNANCVTGIRPDTDEEYRWVYTSGVGFRLQRNVNGTWTYFGDGTVFDDELSVPLGFVENGLKVFYIKDSDKLAKLWTNNTTSPITTFGGSGGNYSSMIAVFYINNVRYEYGCVRTTDLPILIRVPYEYQMSQTPGTNQNQITDQSWQSGLGLRKVFNVSLDTGNCKLHGNILLNGFVCVFEYVPASSQVS